MRIVISDGCLSAGASFDGVPIQEVDQTKILDYLLSKVREAVLANHMSDTPCDTCGDYTSTIIWEI